MKLVQIRSGRCTQLNTKSLTSTSNYLFPIPHFLFLFLFLFFQHYWPKEKELGFERFDHFMVHWEMSLGGIIFSWCRSRFNYCYPQCSSNVSKDLDYKFGYDFDIVFFQSKSFVTKVMQSTFVTYLMTFFFV